MRLVTIGAMLGGVLAWLWPIGIGGKMPVGGDATGFSMGLMGFLRSSILEGRLPLWNDLWGFGFPGLAESQMGVYYPPHVLLYSTLPTEFAYTLSLVLHTLWGALGALWLARRFGISEIGSALAGFVFATSGFAMIHLPHQWAYTVGSWMPWAWGLAWQVARGEGSRRTPMVLSAVLAIQVLPGHFQLAFVTEVGALVLVLASGRRAFRGMAIVGLALVGMAFLAAMQLWPTYRLARLSDADRNFEYLSGFAATPLHLISYVAPGLFHWSPLWRSVAWDTFHTSPEEHLAYVGLVPLFLAMGAARRGWKTDPAVRALVVVAAVTMLLSLGPYVPGFSSLIRLPGFSFFRAPARWGLATALGLAVLAARGFDAWRDWPRPGRSAVGFSGLAVAMVVVVVLGFELALASSRGGALPAVAAGFDEALKALPWAGEPTDEPFRVVMAEAYRSQDDIRVQVALTRQGGKPVPPPGPTLAASRFAIYRQELAESGLLVLGLLAVSTLARRPRGFVVGLLILTSVDALMMARHRPFDLGPARPLIEQSPVLARLAREPRGLRSLDPVQNLSMLVGNAPVAAYRTLDLPAPGQLFFFVARGLASDPRTAQALRVAGIGLRILDPVEDRSRAARVPQGWEAGIETIRDPAMAGWIFGADLAPAVGLRDFALLRPIYGSSQAWLINSPRLQSSGAMGNPNLLIDAFRDAKPLPLRSSTPEQAEVYVEVTEAGPSMVVLSRTFDPEWQARWSGPGGDRPAEVVRVLGGWQGVVVPEPGRWTLHLDYPGRAAWQGLAASGLTWLAWLVACWRSGKTRPTKEAST